MAIPEWKLPTGVDRGLWDYLHAAEMVSGYDEQMRASPLADADVVFCERAFHKSMRLLDLGCGTGRLCAHFSDRGFECVGVDLSEAMLSVARANVPRAMFVRANLVDLIEPPGEPFDCAACLFSTLGMVRGAENRARVLANAYIALKPNGTFVLHAHNRYFSGLGARRVWRERFKALVGSPSAGDISMPQAYGGAPLTLHHFTRGELERAIAAAGFALEELYSIGIDGRPARGAGAYGWLARAVKPA